MSDFEQGGIMGLMEKIVRALLYDKDLDMSGADTFQDMESESANDKLCKSIGELCKSIDAGKINEAENSLYDIMDSKTQDGLKLALMFYSYLNEKNDAFLTEYHFSREEIRQGLENVVSMYGLDGAADAFSDYQ